MEGEPTLCVMCAWRETCKKKFIARQGIEILKCRDYTRDLTLPKEEEK